MTQRRVHGPAVRAIREALGIKGSDFCIRAGITHGHLVMIERHGRAPSAALALRIANELGVSLDAISYSVPECPSCAKAGAA